jgi:mannose-6-phosphate isomerase-like protein (cupin superfamily)
MGARLTPRAVAIPTRHALETRLRAECASAPRWWENAPGDTYDWHEHSYHKVLICQAGGVTFHTEDGDVTLHPGDRLDIEPGTLHAATVGSDGVTCVEASL